MGSCRSFADCMRHVYWIGGRVGQITSPYGVGGETGYTVPLTLQHVGGKDDKGLDFLFLHSKTLLGFVCSFVLGSPHKWVQRGDYFGHQ